MKKEEVLFAIAGVALLFLLTKSKVKSLGAGIGNAGAMQGTNGKLVEIMDGYFKFSGTKPKKPYSENELRSIRANFTVLLLNDNYTKAWNYAKEQAAKFGVSVSKAEQYLAKNKHYIPYLTSREAVESDFSIGGLFSNIGQGIGDVIGGFFGGALGAILKKVVPPLLLVGGLYLGFKHLNKKV